MCIGTPKVIGDAVGPITGSILKLSKFELPVYGTIEDPITSVNYIDKRKEILNKHPHAKIVAIDAAFTNIKSEEGIIKFRTYGVSPGRGIERDFKSLGDVSLMGIVCTSKENETNEDRVLKLIKENVTYINNISETAATLIMRSYENSQIHKQKFLNKLILKISKI